MFINSTVKIFLGCFPFEIFQIFFQFFWIEICHILYLEISCETGIASMSNTMSTHWARAEYVASRCAEQLTATRWAYSVTCWAISGNAPSDLQRHIERVTDAMTPCVYALSTHAERTPQRAERFLTAKSPMQGSYQMQGISDGGLAHDALAHVFLALTSFDRTMGSRW